MYYCDHDDVYQFYKLSFQIFALGKHYYSFNFPISYNKFFNEISSYRLRLQ